MNNKIHNTLIGFCLSSLSMSAFATTNPENTEYIIDSVRPETKFLAAQGQDGRYAALAVRLINQ